MRPIVAGQKQPKDRVLGQDMFLGHQGPIRRDIPDSGAGMSRTKTLCKAPSSVILDQEWLERPAIGSGRPGIWVLTSQLTMGEIAR